MSSRLQSRFTVRFLVTALLLALCLTEPGQGQSAVPTPATLVLRPNSLVGGMTSAGTVTLSAPATSGPITAILSSSNPSVAAPSTASVTIPAGSSQATFTVTTSPVSAASIVTLSATAGGQTRKASLTVSPLLSGQTLSPAAVTGGTSCVGKVTLSGPAGNDGSGGITVLLSGVGVVIPAGVQVPAGSQSVNFPIGTRPVASDTIVKITASLLGAAKTASLLVKAPVLVGVSLTPRSINGGSGAFGTVTLSGIAAVDTTVAVSSGNGAVTIGGSALVPAGQTLGPFSVSASPVAANVTVTLSAALGALTKTITLIVKATTAVSLTLVPSTLASSYGQSVTLTATASSAAGAGPPPGAVVVQDSTSYLFNLPLDGSGLAALSTADLSVGIHPLSGLYNGDAAHAAAVSPGVTLTVSGAGRRIMPLGDSITLGVSADPTVSGGWRGPLWGMTSTQGWQCQYVGCVLSGPHGIGGCEGHGGKKIEQIQGIVPAAIANYSPNVILLQIGTNNLGGSDPTRRDTPAQALTKMAALLDTLIAAAPQARIVVASVTPAADPTIDALFVTFNQGLPGLVQARAGSGATISFVDMHTLCGFGPSDISDGIHPTASGYLKMAGVWYNALVALPVSWQ